mmetsp:Transcript_27118/g.69875  ORF Transcript_27118/g.69875 Transcript_27118/m.69875 type:complete len:93 (+) Transcript_27118:538-816(+)
MISTRDRLLTLPREKRYRCTLQYSPSTTKRKTGTPKPNNVVMLKTENSDSFILASFVTDIDVPADNGLTKTNHSPGVKQPLEDGFSESGYEP